MSNLTLTLSTPISNGLPPSKKALILGSMASPSPQGVAQTLTSELRRPNVPDSIPETYIDIDDRTPSSQHSASARSVSSVHESSPPQPSPVSVARPSRPPTAALAWSTTAGLGTWVWGFYDRVLCCGRTRRWVSDGTDVDAFDLSDSYAMETGKGAQGRGETDAVAVAAAQAEEGWAHGSVRASMECVCGGVGECDTCLRAYSVSHGHPRGAMGAVYQPYHSQGGSARKNNRQGLRRGSVGVGAWLRRAGEDPGAGGEAGMAHGAMGEEARTVEGGSGQQYPYQQWAPLWRHGDPSIDARAGPGPSGNHNQGVATAPLQHQHAANGHYYGSNGGPRSGATPLGGVGAPVLGNPRSLELQQRENGAQRSLAEEDEPSVAPQLLNSPSYTRAARATDHTSTHAPFFLPRRPMRLPAQPLSPAAMPGPAAAALHAGVGTGGDTGVFAGQLRPDTSVTSDSTLRQGGPASPARRGLGRVSSQRLSVTAGVPELAVATTVTDAAPTHVSTSATANADAGGGAGDGAVPAVAGVAVGAAVSPATLRLQTLRRELAMAEGALDPAEALSSNDRRGCAPSYELGTEDGVLKTGVIAGQTLSGVPDTPSSVAFLGIAEGLHEVEGREKEGEERAGDAGVKNVESAKEEEKRGQDGEGQRSDAEEGEVEIAAEAHDKDAGRHTSEEEEKKGKHRSKPRRKHRR